MNDTIQTYTDTQDQNIRARIVTDFTCESPREWDNTCLFHFKKERGYNLPQEASNIIEWQYHEEDSEYDDDEFKEEKKRYFEELNRNYFLFGMYYSNYSSA